MFNSQYKKVQKPENGYNVLGPYEARNEGGRGTPIMSGCIILYVDISVLGWVGYIDLLLHAITLFLIRKL